MSTHRITVYDYEGISVGAPQHMREEYRQKEPLKYEVDAWCLGGEEGFRAWFIIGDTFYEAAGDDGHWWLVGTMNAYWVAKFKETVASIEVRDD